MPETNYDYIIIGSGFGGSVSALRLSEKGYKVLVIEKGKRYNSKDFPKSNWNLRKWLWLPSLHFFGIMKMTFYKHIGILSGTGVGGGSLVYANTLARPKKAFYQTGSWAHLGNWDEELRPFYETALEMLGAADTPQLELGDTFLKELAIRQHRETYFEPTKVSVFFGEPDVTVPDPYFDGKGPERTGCNSCGGCMTGCRYNAKNSLDKNYLYLAEQNGVDILPEKEVIDVEEIKSGEKTEYELTYKDSTKFIKRKYKVRSKGVVFAGGVLGTVKLLIKLKNKSLSRLSDKVGEEVRTNNESLIFNVSADKEKDFSKGVAIGSIYHPDDYTHLEPVRYAQGSGFWRTGLLPFVPGSNVFIRFGRIIKEFFKSPLTYLKLYTVRDFARQSVVLLFMQHIDSTLSLRKGWFRLKSKVTEGTKPTAHIPDAKKLADAYSEISGGKSFVYITESIFNIPSTAHILGGAVMGTDEKEGVIDKNNRVFGYNNMYICDGSMISANPGVNPSLTITAISERAMSKIPAKNNS
jgi:cholesterol oxidase